MKKFEMLPVIAALFIAMLVIPFSALPVNALTPSTNGGFASVVTIPEDDLKRNTGIMVLGLLPTYTTILGADGWYTDSMCTSVVPVTDPAVVVGAELTSEPWVGTTAIYYQKTTNFQCVAHEFMAVWPVADKGLRPGYDLLSQHKILATLNGALATPTYAWCEVVEKEKAKIPPVSDKTISKRQFNDEIIKTTLKDVTSNFICKFYWVKPGVGALDVYFVGPKVKSFIADHMLIVTVGYKVGRTTVWANDLQDICILGWSMGTNALQIWLFKNPGLSTVPSQIEYFYSWDDPINKFVSCDEAALWQLTYITGGWPWSTN